MADGENMDRSPSATLKIWSPCLPGPHAILQTAVLWRAVGDPVISTQQCMFQSYGYQDSYHSACIQSVPQRHTL